MQIVFDTYHHRRFTRAECCASLYDRGSYWNADRYERAIAKGVRGPRHMSVGRFRWKDAAKAVTGETPCHIPWTIVEPEEGDVVERWGHARTIIETLRLEGYYSSAIQVRFSGNKSFWVCLPSGMMGNPLGTVYDQKALRERVILPLAECKVDEHLWDARHLARVLGSEHERGGRVRWWPAWVFMEATLDELFRPMEWAQIDPASVSPVPALVDYCKAKTLFHVPEQDRVPRDATGSGFMRATDEGVEDGSRNYDAFRRACVLVRRHGQEGAWRELLDWNARNMPPLPERELRGCLRSAIRTVEYHDKRAA